MPFQQGAPLQEAVLGQLVEGVPGMASARDRQQVVDEREGVGGVGAPVPDRPDGPDGFDGFDGSDRSTGPDGPDGSAGPDRSTGPLREPRARPHDLLQPGVHGPEQRPEPLRLVGAELGARPVQPVHPRVQGVAPAADLRDRVALGVLDGRGDGHAQRLEPLGGAVLADDRGAVAGGVVEVVLEEVGAAGGGDAVAVVEQALGDGFAAEGLAGVRIAAQHLVHRRHGRPWHVREWRPGHPGHGRERQPVHRGHGRSGQVREQHLTGRRSGRKGDK